MDNKIKPKRRKKDNTKIILLPKNNYHKPVITEDDVCWKIIMMNRKVDRTIIE